MHRPQRDALARRQQQLLLRSAELRVTLAHQAQALRSPLALADQLRAGVHWLRQHPVWPLAALALLTLRRPRPLLRWLPRLIGGWQLLLRVRRWLGSDATGKP